MLKLLSFGVAACLLAGASSFAQPLPAGRGGLGGGAANPNLTAEQRAAAAQMSADLAPLQERLAAARGAVVQVSLAKLRDDAAIRAAIESVKTAERSLAQARAGAFAKTQSSPNRLTPEQALAISTASGVTRGGRGLFNAPTIPHLTAAQGNALLEMSSRLKQFTEPLTEARAAVIAAALTQPPNDSAIAAKVEAVAAAEWKLAVARADAAAKFQASSNKLDAEQLAALAAAGGIFGQGGFSQPDPLDFNDHRGYVSLFDGVSLKGWDGNPKFWRVEDHAMVGESSQANPSGNQYIVYRGTDAHDFTLKFEIKVEGSGGSGLQYRSKTGIPWTRPIAPNVLANIGTVNLNWMQTGPQADFWPSQIFSGQFYSENTPMGIMAYRGQVVEGAGLGSRRLMAAIGDLSELGNLVKANDWNQYTVIARGGVLLHIINGQLMAVMIDDDPESSNNWTGQFGIEIEAITKVSVRNIWLKKLN